MKISTIEINNFGGITSSTIHPGKITSFIGPIGTGKTSTMEAIRFAFIGKADSSVIHSKCSQASVKVTFEYGTFFERIRKIDKVAVKVNGKGTTAKSCNEYLLQKGIHSNIFDGLSSVNFFEGLSSKDLTEFFLSILPLQADFKTILDLIEELNFEEPSREQIDYLAELFDHENDFSLKLLETGYKKAYEHRREYNALIKSITPRRF